MKQKEGEEEERRKRRRDPRKNQTHSVKSPVKPNPPMAKPNPPLCCHLYLQNQTYLQKKSFFLLLRVLQIRCVIFAPKHKSSVLDLRSTCTKDPPQPLPEQKSSVLDSISLVEIESNKLRMLVC